MSNIPPLSWKNVIGYGLGDVANNFAFAMGALFLLNYYTDVAGIPAAASLMDGTAPPTVPGKRACAAAARPGHRIPGRRGIRRRLAGRFPSGRDRPGNGNTGK